MLQIPYGSGSLPLEEGNAAVLRSAIGELKAAGSGQDIVRAALAAPIGSPRLRELAAGKKNCVIIISDHTRPVPSRVITPQVLERIRRGSPEAEIRILIESPTVV